MTVVIAFEGVLRSDVRSPIVEGEDLVRSIVEHMRVVVASTGDDKDASGWLERRAITGLAGVRSGKTFAEHLADERVTGTVSLVITADTDEARAAYRQGIPVMLFASPHCIDVRWRPERKDWGQISEGENV